MPKRRPPGYTSQGVRNLNDATGIQRDRPRDCFPHLPEDRDQFDLDLRAWVMKCRACKATIRTTYVDDGGS